MKSKCEERDILNKGIGKKNDQKKINQFKKEVKTVIFPHGMIITFLLK